MMVERFAVIPGGAPSLAITHQGIVRPAQFGGVGSTVVPVSVSLAGDELGTISEKEIVKGRELSTPDGWTLKVQIIGGKIVAFRDGKPLPECARDLDLRVKKGMYAALLVAVQTAVFGAILLRDSATIGAAAIGASAVLALVALLGRRGTIGFGWTALLGSLLGAVDVLLVAATTDPRFLAAPLLYICFAITWLVNARPASRALRGKRVRAPVTGPLRLLMLTVIAFATVIVIVVLVAGALYLDERQRKQRQREREATPYGSVD